MANTIGEKELKNSWPFEDGLTAGTTKTHGRVPYLIPEGHLGVSSIVPNRYKKGL